MNPYIALIVVAITAVKVIAQYFFQLSIQKTNRFYIWIGILCYAFFGYLVHEILTLSNSLAITNIIASNVSDVIIIAMGWVVFKQALKPIQILGILTVLVGSYMVSQ
jgi:drug/metabolite transporter (DMT)-like permease